MWRVGASKADIYTVDANGETKKTLCGLRPQNEKETENEVINLYPEVEYQTFEGFGGAITQAAGAVYSRMDEEKKAALVHAYFSPEQMNYQFVRIPIDSCDFSEGPYTGFEQIEKYILPLLDDAEKVHGGKLPVMLSPWSPPEEWKSNKIRQQGGKLLPAYYGEYAEYLCQYIRWYRDRGYLVTRLTLQNEPHAVQTWDSCVWNAAEQKTFLRDYMWPVMKKYGLSDIEIYLWDHNKERVYEWMKDILDEDTKEMVAGAAVHWYSGDHFEALDICRERFPDKKLIVSESCFEYRVYGSVAPAFAAVKFSREIIGDLNHGISAFCDWNLLLDESGGPCYANNFCLAPFHYDTAKRELIPQLIQKFMKMFSKTIVPGSVRVASSRYTDEIEVTAWKHPDGKLSVIMLNKSDENKPVCIRLEDTETDFVLEPKSICTAVFQ